MQSEILCKAEYQIHTRSDLALICIWDVPLLIAAIYGITQGEILASLIAIATAAFIWWVFRSIAGSIRKNAFAHVYSDRIEVGSTFLIKRFARLEASKIESSYYMQSFFGRNQYGHILIRGTGARAMRISPVKNADKFLEKVRSISNSSNPKN